MLIPFPRRLENSRPLLLDGATGTELARMGLDLSGPSWTAAVIRHAPERLVELHRAYVGAGAEIVTANTFRTHARSLRCLGWADDADKVTLEAVTLARAGAAERAYVAGSIAPLEDCYSPELTPTSRELEAEHRRMAAALARAEVDLILIETQITVREAAIAAAAAQSTGLPFAVSYTTRSDGRLLSGETLEEAMDAVMSMGPVAILLNCVPVDEIVTSWQRLPPRLRPFLTGGYANTGRLTPTGGWVATEAVDPAVFAEYVRSWIESGRRWVGGCCGTTPDHISAIHSLLCDEGKNAGGGECAPFLPGN